MAEMPFVLKMLYEEDLLNEDIIIAWGDAPAVSIKVGVDTASATKIRALSQKVLEWLKQSDDEEE
jgi:translation initiation factor 5